MPKKTTSNLDSKKENQNSVYLKIKDEIERKSTRNSAGSKKIFDLIKVGKKKGKGSQPLL